MRLIRFTDTSGTIYHGIKKEGETAEIVSGDPLTLAKPTGKMVDIGQYLSPVEPTAIICIGLNYKAHADEINMAYPKFPVVFMKNPAAATGHLTDIVIPESCKDPEQVDYEAELAVVIGKKAKNVSETDAMGYVAGFTVANDVSARLWQTKGGAGQWIRGKSFDTFCPLGPELVTMDEIQNADNLAISCYLNDKEVQNSNTSDMIFSIAKLISFLSEDTTLLPGTVILTGTPEGVGFTRKPPLFLKKGGTVSVSIETIGTLTNSVV